MHLYTQQTSFYKRKVWCCGKPAGERFVRGGHRWMRLRQSKTWKNNRDKWCQRRRPAHPLLAEPTVTCSPANVWNWLSAAGKEPSLFGVLTYLLSNYSSYFTCILRIWLPLFTKIQTLSYMPPGHALLYPVIDTEGSLSIFLWLSEYCPANCSHPQISVCLIIGVAYAYLEMLLNLVLLIHATSFFKKACNSESWV